jgi:tripartite-type tricarboxylate transporter receptor subunit TctC
MRAQPILTPCLTSSADDRRLGTAARIPRSLHHAFAARVAKRAQRSHEITKTRNEETAMRIYHWPLAAVIACTAVSTPSVQAAETYPTRPVRFIIPFAPGGSNDTIARLFAQHLTEHLGQPVIVDNRSGAGSLVGNEIASKSQPDGHTIVIISASFAFSSALYKKLPYDPVKSFSHVAKIATGPVVLAVNPSLPAKTVKELIALATAKPGQLNFASSGVGSAQHLGMELLKTLVKIDVTHVPFKGGGPATLSVMTGDSHISIGSVISLIPHIRSGKLRALATGGLKRSSALPDLPTIDEAGVKGYEASNWWGVLAPAKTPPSVITRLDNEIKTIVAKEAVAKRLSNDGAEPDYLSQQTFADFVAKERAKWTQVVRAAGITPQ